MNPRALEGNAKEGLKMKFGLVSAIAIAFAAVAIPAAAQKITPSTAMPVALVSGNVNMWVQAADCDFPNGGCSDPTQSITTTLTGGYLNRLEAPLVFSASQAQGIPIGAVSTVSAIIGFNPNISDLGSVSLSVGLFAAALTEGTPDIAASNAGATINVTLDYYFEVIAPKPGVQPGAQVPVQFLAVGTASGNEAGTAFSVFSSSGGAVFEPESNSNDLACTPAPCGPGGLYGNRFDLNESYQLTVGQVYIASLSAQAQGALYGDADYVDGDGLAVSEQLSTFLDPNIVVPDGYSVLVSPNVIGTVPGVPEPSTWALLLIGFAGLGLAGYRTSRTRDA
jgi:PEP-CTERM motif-containing protein